MAVSIKTQEVEELKSELSSMINNEGKALEKEEDKHNSAKEILELSNKIRDMSLHIGGMEVQLKQSHEKRDEHTRENEQLKLSIESKNEVIDELQDEVESFTKALSDAREQNESLRHQCDSLTAEVETSNHTILESTDEIASLRTELTGYTALRGELTEYQEKMKCLEKEHASVCARLESKNKSYKELMNKSIDQKDELKAAEHKMNKLCEEASSLRIKLQECDASSNISCKQIAVYQGKLKDAEAAKSSLESAMSSLESAMQSKVTETEDLRKLLLAQRDAACTTAATEGDLDTEASALREWKLVAEQSLNATCREVEVISKLNQELRDETLLLREKFEQAIAECDRLQMDNMDYTKEVEVTKAVLAEALSKNSSLQIELASKASDCDKLEKQLFARNEEFESTLSKLKADALSESESKLNTITQLESAIAAATSKIAALTTQAEKQSTEINTLQRDLNSSEKDLCDAVNEVDALERLLSKTKETLQLRETELNLTTTECRRLSSEIKVYQEKLSVAENDYVSLRVRFAYFEELSKELADSKSECEALMAKGKCFHHQLASFESFCLMHKHLVDEHNLCCSKRT
jgi:chromosome segregation ATPase